MDYLEYRKKYIRKQLKKQKTVPLWRCPDGMIWRLCFDVLQTNFLFLRRCVLRQPYFFGTGLFSLLVYFIYILYSRDYSSNVEFSGFNDAVTFGDYGLNEYHGRLEKSSVMVNKVLEKQKQNQKPKSLLIHQNATQNPVEAIRRKLEMKVQEENNNNEILNGIKILIYSQHNVDISVLSDALNTLSEVKYIHEPLQLTDHEGLDKAEKEDLLRNVLRCNYQSLQRKSGWRWQSVYKVVGEGLDRTHKYEYEKAFCYEGGVINLRCPTKVVRLEELCSSKPHRVVKVGSVKHIKQLVGLLEYRYPMIHIVRDPRAVFASLLQRGSMEDIEKHLKYIQLYCNEIERDINYVTENLMEYAQTPNKLYRLIRYEDIEKSPIDQIGKLLKSLHIDIDDVDEKKLSEMQTYFEEKLKEDREHWTHLTEPILKRIQNDCDRTMEMFGYFKLADFVNLAKVASRHFLDPLYDLQYLAG